MMFWDSSALVPLVVEQASSARMRQLLGRDASLLAWVLSEVEVLSALARLEREKALSVEGYRQACESLDIVWGGTATVSLADGVKLRAKRLLRLHALRAADACQLGAALLAAQDAPTGWKLVSLDDRLRDAADREGFTVLP